MIRLRPEQFDAFRDEMRTELAERLARRGEERFPERMLGRAPAEVRAEARRLAAAARERGFVSEQEVALFYDISMELGPGFEQGPTGAWVRELLKERGLPPRERLEKLRARVLGVEVWTSRGDSSRGTVTGRVTRVVGKGPPPRLEALRKRRAALDEVAAGLRTPPGSAEAASPDPERSALRARVEQARGRVMTEQALRLDLGRRKGRARELANALRTETDPDRRRSLEGEIDSLRRRWERTLSILEKELERDLPRAGSADAEDPCVARVASDRVSEVAAVREEAERRLRVARDLGVAAGSGTEGDRVVVAVELSRMPGDTLDLLRRAGTRVVVCRGSVVDGRPELASGRPRGWPPGTSWRDVPGLWDGIRNEVVVATRGHAPGRAGRVPRTGDGHASASLAVHVACHAVDARCGNPSSSPEFRAARAADRERLPEYGRQPGSAGLEETWAESAALWSEEAAGMASALPGLHRYWGERAVARRAAGSGELPALEAGEARTTRVWRRSSLGTAALDAEGSIVLDLRASDGRGLLGDGRVVCPRDDSRHAAILAHVGGLAPGETKPVPPWPEGR